MQTTLLVLTSFAICLALPPFSPAQSGPGDGGPALQARLIAPEGVLLAPNGDLFISERAGYRVRRVNSRTGVITTIAGTGERGYSGDGGPAASAQFGQVAGMALDRDGNLYIADLWNSRIRRVDARTGIVTTVVGTGTAGYSGDGGPALQAAITAAFSMTFDQAGNLFFTDTENHVVRRVEANTGIITTVAGTGRWGYAGDGGPAREASLARPHCVVLTAERDLYICDSFNHRIRRVDGATGRISTIAGTGYFGSAGDQGPATSAAITWVGSMTFDSTGSLLFSDIATHRIRRIDRLTGVIQTIAGNGMARFAGDGAAALEGSFELPAGLAWDRSGNLLVADMWNGRVRRIDASTGTLSTVAGSALSPETPDWRFRVNYDAAAIRTLNNRPPALEHPAMGRVTQLELPYNRPGGVGSGMMSVFLPPGTTEPRPVVMILHSRNNQEIRPRTYGGLNSWARLLAASGFVTVLPDHRIGVGAVSAESGLGDIRTALGQVRENAGRLGADPDRICFLSFGDGVAAAVALLTEAGAGLRCLAAFYPTVDLMDSRLFSWGVEPEELRRRMSLATAMTSSGWRTPVFIAGGSRDRPESLEPLTALRSRAPSGHLTVVMHSNGQSGFERLLHDAESRSIMEQLIAFLKAQTDR